MSHAGLAARGLGEVVHPGPLLESLATGDVQADRWLAMYKGAWGEDLSRIHDAASL